MAYKKRIVQAAAFCFIMVVIAAFSIELYFMEDWVDGVLVWNSREAYVFSRWTGMGYHSTTFGTGIALIPAYFGVSKPPDDTNGYTLVYRITPTSLERYVAPRVTFRTYIPMGTTVYAWSGGPLWKWNGDHFEIATPDEQREIIEIPKVTIPSASKDFSDQHGWSLKNLATSSTSKTEIELDGKTIDFFMIWQDSNREISLDVQLPDRPREKILHAKSRLHLVSKSEYKSRFQKEQNRNAGR